jgi:hypothetical protein
VGSESTQSCTVNGITGSLMPLRTSAVSRSNCIPNLSLRLPHLLAHVFSLWIIEGLFYVPGPLVETQFPKCLI